MYAIATPQLTSKLLVPSITIRTLGAKQLPVGWLLSKTNLPALSNRHKM